MIGAGERATPTFDALRLAGLKAVNPEHGTHLVKGQLPRHALGWPPRVLTASAVVTVLRQSAAAEATDQRRQRRHVQPQPGGFYKLALCLAFPRQHLVANPQLLRELAFDCGAGRRQPLSLEPVPA